MEVEGEEMKKIQVWMRPDQYELAVGCFEAVKERLRIDVAYTSSEAGKMAIQFTRTRIDELIALFKSSLKKPNGNITGGC